MTENYLDKNDENCSTCCPVSDGEKCQNNLLSEKIRRISFEDWFRAWFIDTAELCEGCQKDIHFWDESYEHFELAGAFCSDCAKIFQSGSKPPFVK